MWYAGSHHVTDLRGCEQLCSCCSACRYVSFSGKHDDCSWYADCALPLQLAFGGESYRTSRVQQASRPSAAGCRAIKARGLSPSLPRKLGRLAALVQRLQDHSATRNASQPSELSEADLAFMRATAKEVQDELTVT